MRLFLTFLFLTSMLFCDVVQNCNPVQKDYLPTYIPCHKNETCLLLEGDFIYMKPKVDNLFFAVANNKVIAPNFEYSPGSKALIGLYFPRWTWDFVIRGTELISSSKKHVNSPLYPLFFEYTQSLKTPLFQNALNHLDIKYFGLDIEVGKSISLTPKIIFRIHGGIKNTIIRQKLKTTYKNSSPFANNPALSVIESRNIFKNHSNGTGVRIGFDTKWKVYSHLSMLIDPSLTFMLTSFDMLQNYYNNINNAGSVSPSNLKYKEHIWVVRPYAQIAFGLGYNRRFHSFSLNGKAAYEFNYFWEFNLNRRYHILADSLMNKGDFFFQGLTLALGFDF